MININGEQVLGSKVVYKILDCHIHSYAILNRQIHITIEVLIKAG